MNSALPINQYYPIVFNLSQFILKYFPFQFCQWMISKASQSVYFPIPHSSSSYSQISCMYENENINSSYPPSLPYNL